MQLWWTEMESGPEWSIKLNLEVTASDSLNSTEAQKLMMQRLTSIAGRKFGELCDSGSWQELKSLMTLNLSPISQAPNTDSATSSKSSLSAKRI